jgi:hypothetical protein
MSLARRKSSTVALALVGALAFTGIATPASGSLPRRAALPAPGSPSQVAALVATSSKIEVLPSPLIPALAVAGADNTASYYPATSHGCAGTTRCVFGDASSKKTVVLFGDSHAAMWLPPLVYDANHLGFRVVLLWFAGCPAADLTVWNAGQHGINPGCDAWRSQSITDIKLLAPSLVLLSDRTTAVLGATGKIIPGAVWQAGMKQTISDFLASKLRVAVIGDITALTNRMPECLAAFPNKIQNCSSPNPNRGFKTHVADEKAAAKAENVTYINPQGWLCTKKCSPVVGNMVVYYDSLHASATYAEYLSLLFADAIKPLLPSG